MGLLGDLFSGDPERKRCLASLAADDRAKFERAHRMLGSEAHIDEFIWMWHRVGLGEEDVEAWVACSAASGFVPRLGPTTGEDGKLYITDPATNFVRWVKDRLEDGFKSPDELPDQSLDLFLLFRKSNGFEDAKAAVEEWREALQFSGTAPAHYSEPPSRTMKHAVALQKSGVSAHAHLWQGVPEEWRNLGLDRHFVWSLSNSGWASPPQPDVLDFVVNLSAEGWFPATKWLLIVLYNSGLDVATVGRLSCVYSSRWSVHPSDLDYIDWQDVGFYIDEVVRLAPQPAQLFLAVELLKVVPDLTAEDLSRWAGLIFTFTPKLLATRWAVAWSAAGFRSPSEIVDFLQARGLDMEDNRVSLNLHGYTREQTRAMMSDLIDIFADSIGGFFLIVTGRPDADGNDRPIRRTVMTATRTHKQARTIVCDPQKPYVTFSISTHPDATPRKILELPIQPKPAYEQDSLA